jgi:vanillate/3-O-methylgallate O-demethylase
MTEETNVGAAQRARYESLVSGEEQGFVGVPQVLFSPGITAQAADSARNIFSGWGLPPVLGPAEYAGWQEETTAHTQTCYLGDWTGLAKLRIKGPQAMDFLLSVGMNDLTASAFAIGQIKHHVQLDERGYVASEGVICRLAESEYLYTSGYSEWTTWQFSLAEWDAEIEDITPELFIYGIQGPNSLRTVEAATGQSLRDIDFNHSRPAAINGIPVRILRTGISGELGYEVHGATEHGNAVWHAITEAGGQFGLRHLGFRSMGVQHVEAGIATIGVDYLPASIGTPGMARYRRTGGASGSFIPTNGLIDYFRTPDELGWGLKRLPDREFVGRDALVREAADGGPKRALVGLVWDTSDVISLFASFFESNAMLPQMEFPKVAAAEFNQVLVDGEPSGVTTGRIFSGNLRKVVSLGVVDRVHGSAGASVSVVWGSPAGPQRTIRATVSELPLKPDRRRMDVTSL